MTWTDEIRDFISEHLFDDTTRLLLSAHRYPHIDIPFAVEQIEARRRLRTKLPEWYALPDLIMGGRVPAEQCSSEQTARFKRSIMLQDARSLCDMTGGMGVDFWYMSQGLSRAIYTERQSDLCAAARHNFQVLAQDSCHTDIEVREGLSTSLPIPDVDVIYLDPARRSTDGSRIYEISDCEPDLVTWQHELLQHCRQLIVKVSPMADISRTISRLLHVSDVYVVSLKGECKELLVSQHSAVDGRSTAAPQIHCIDLYPDRIIDFSYSIAEMQKSANGEEITFANPNEEASLLYFYEPDVSIMKAQAFLPLMSRFPICQLDGDCHYFLSHEKLLDFPGRIFQVDERVEFSSKSLKRLRTSIPQANIATRAFPLSPEQLRARTGIRDGGEVYLFGVMLHSFGPVLYRCHKIYSYEA